MTENGDRKVQTTTTLFYESTIYLESTENFSTIRVPLQVSQKWGNGVHPLEKMGVRRSPAFTLNLSTARTETAERNNKQEML